MVGDLVADVSGAKTEEIMLKKIAIAIVVVIIIGGGDGTTILADLIILRSKPSSVIRKHTKGKKLLLKEKLLIERHFSLLSNSLR